MTDEAKIETAEAWRFTSQPADRLTVDVSGAERIAFSFQALVRDINGERPWPFVLEDEHGPYLVVADHERRFKLRLEEVE